MNAENADENDMEAKVQAPQMLSSILPNLLPPGPLNKRTIECINVRSIGFNNHRLWSYNYFEFNYGFQSTFDQIQRDNPHLVPWLSDVQETAVKLHTKLRQCNKLEKNLQSWELFILIFVQENFYACFSPEKSCIVSNDDLYLNYIHFRMRFLIITCYLLISNFLSPFYLQYTQVVAF